MIKPFSQACANNGPPILEHLQRLCAQKATAFEIGSGTGQHSIFFAGALPQLQWQPSDLPDNHPGIQQWIDESGLNNVLSPINFDVSHPAGGLANYDVVFMANTLHIFSWQQVQQCFALLPSLLNPQGLLVIYGPFKYGGQFTSDSNERFDQWLKAADSERGIRDFERINKLALDQGLELLEDNPMPANNRLLVWRFKRQ